MTTPSSSTKPQSARRPSRAVVMLAHLVPLIGVVAFGWDLLSVLLLFWAESLFLGLVATVQALRAAGRTAIGTVLLFIVVFVALAAAHLMVIAVLAGAAGEEIPSALQPDRFAELPLFSALAAIYLAGLDWIVQQRPALLTVALPSLMLGHAIDAWMDGCMDAPSTEPPTHGRAILAAGILAAALQRWTVMQLALLGGAAAMALFDLQDLTAVLALLVVFKAMLEGWSSTRRKER